MRLGCVSRLALKIFPAKRALRPMFYKGITSVFPENGRPLTDIVVS
ncbi:hypothetical protein PHOSAC3_150059 [Mesotoga infera]|nr:hypothetical protein PHOSAC3_150059 [Mesotoga infera]